MGKSDALFDDDTTTNANVGVRSAGFKPTVVTHDNEESGEFIGTKRDIKSKVITLDRIIAKDQVRKSFGEKEIEEMAHSLKTVGQTTPILVYWSHEDDRYVVIAGERRFRGAKLAGLTELSCKIHPHRPEEDELVELQFVENAIRVDLNPIEEAQSYKRLQELKGFTTTQLAERIGKSQSAVSRSMSLLKLPEEIQQHISKGELPVSVAREAAKLKDVAKQAKMVEEYLRGELTTSDAQAQTNKRAGAKKASTKKSKKWAVDGVAISVSYSSATTLADIADALEKKVAQIRSDKENAVKSCLID